MISNPKPNPHPAAMGKSSPLSGQPLPHDDPRLQDAMKLMRGLVRSPLGQDPDRDQSVKDAWLVCDH